MSLHGPLPSKLSVRLRRRSDDGRDPSSVGALHAIMLSAIRLSAVEAGGRVS